MYHIQGGWRTGPQCSTSVQPVEFVISRLDPRFSCERAIEVLSRLAGSSSLGAHATAALIFRKSEVSLSPGKVYFQEGLMPVERCQKQKCQILLSITICLQFRSFRSQRLQAFTINALFIWPA